MLLLFLLWSLVLAGSICNETLVQAPVEVGGITSLQQYGMVLVGSQNPPFSLIRVEYATGSQMSVVPFTIVTSLHESVDHSTCSFVDVSGALFQVNVSDGALFKVSPLQVVVDSRSVLYAPDPLLLGFIAQSTRALYVANGTGKVAEEVAENVETFEFAPNSQYLVYSGAEGLVKWSRSSGGSKRVWSNATGIKAFAISPDSQHVAYVDQTRLFVDDVVWSEHADERQFLGWSGDSSVVVFTRLDEGGLWGVGMERMSFSLGAESVGAVQVVVEGDYCLYLSRQLQLWSVALAAGGEEGLQLGDASTVFFETNRNQSVVFVSSQMVLSASPIQSNHSVVILETEPVRSLVSVLSDRVVYLRESSGFAYVSSLEAENSSQMVLAQNVSLMAVQGDTGVSAVAYLAAEKELLVTCLIASTFVGADEVFGDVSAVEGHIFFTNTSVMVQLASLIQVGGSAVLNGVQISVSKCGEAELLQANLLVGETGAVEPLSVAVACGSECPTAAVTQKATQILVIGIDQNGCNSQFSWTVFGIVVGIAAFLVIVVVAVLWWWNRRQVKAANSNLRLRELKYRAIAEDVENK
jgi:hypothetical protein